MVNQKTNSALVTGATGFVGSHLAARLLREGWQVRVLARTPGKLTPELRAAAQVLEGGLSDAEALAQAVRDVSVVFHCAANVRTWDTRQAYYAANVLGVQNLLDAILQHNRGLSRLVHVSTMDVYGFPEQPCDEQCEPRAAGFGYGDTKLQGEQLVAEVCGEQGIPYTIIRPGNIIGPGSQFITRIGAELASGLMLKVDGGQAHAGLVYIDNLVDDLLWAAESNKAIGQCYNVRDAHDATWSDFLAKFRRGIAGKGLVISLPFWAADGAARISEMAWRILLPGREPLWHPLLVRVFGRTCGHHSGKLLRDRAMANRTGFEEAMEISIRWHLKERR